MDELLYVFTDANILTKINNFQIFFKKKIKNISIKCVNTLNLCYLNLKIILNKKRDTYYYASLLSINYI